MTVAELITKLEAFDPSLEVLVEGLENRHFCRVDNPHIVDYFENNIEQSDYTDPRELSEEIQEKLGDKALKQGVFII